MLESITADSSNKEITDGSVGPIVSTTTGGRMAGPGSATTGGRVPIGTYPVRPPDPAPVPMPRPPKNTPVLPHFNI